MGLTLTALIKVEGEIIEAVLDTGSTVTIIQLETLLQLLAKNNIALQSQKITREDAIGVSVLLLIGRSHAYAC